MFDKLKNVALGKKIPKTGSPEDDDEGPITAFKNGFLKVFHMLMDYFRSLFLDIKVMKLKSKNLLQANINLGLKHLNNDRIGDAILRFRIISFFWPNHVKTYYYLAHCYLIKSNYAKSEKYLKILLQMDPSYEDKVGNMIRKIDLANEE